MDLIEFFFLLGFRKRQLQTNQLLEQIRRQALTPMQRAQEDAAAVAQADAEYQAEARNRYMAGMILLAALTISPIAYLWMVSH